jgi:signal transduction histidine kinase
VAGLVGIVASVVTTAGPIGELARILGLAILVAGVAGLATAGRTFRRTAVALDELGDAAGRVEAGDYSARVRESSMAPRPVRELARAFNAMTARLEANETQRRTLLADVSHELRTPLTVMQGNVEAILDGVHEADDAHLDAILDETRVLARLIDDLRTVALSETGSLALHREPTDLAILATDAAASFRPGAEAAGIELAVEIDDDLPLLDVDPVRIREVLSNLLANAMRHTPSGGSIRIEGRSATTSGDVVVTVRDTGSGIEATLLPHVFDRFVKATGSRGSGLGLAIARALVETHGGSIQVESTPGRGTTFTMRIPVEPGATGR